jgi:hypothetical protein
MDNALKHEWLLADLDKKQTVKLRPDNFASACDTQCIGMLAQMQEFYGDELVLERWPAYKNFLQASEIADNTSVQVNR